MSVIISKLRGMSDQLEARLQARGIRTSDQFLDLVRTPAGRKELADATGVESRMILELANRADLARVKGIGGVFSDLLEHAGVDTVKELATPVLTIYTPDWWRRMPRRNWRVEPPPKMR